METMSKDVEDGRLSLANLAPFIAHAKRLYEEATRRVEQAEGEFLKAEYDKHADRCYSILAALHELAATLPALTDDDRRVKLACLMYSDAQAIENLEETATTTDQRLAASIARDMATLFGLTRETGADR